MASENMFASPTITQHLLRGVAGAGALWASLALAPSHPWGSLGLGVAMLVAFRGCPICWSIGLVETARKRLKRGQALKANRRSACPVRP